jgi:hypothetical protein
VLEQTATRHGPAMSATYTARSRSFTLRSAVPFATDPACSDLTRPYPGVAAILASIRSRSPLTWARWSSTSDYFRLTLSSANATRSRCVICGNELHTFHADALNTTLLPPVRLPGTSWTKPPGGDEAMHLATPVDLWLFDYSVELRCCICRNFAHNQLQPLVEPQPSQT